MTDANIELRQAVLRVTDEWRRILYSDGEGLSIYHTSHQLRDALSELAALTPAPLPAPAGEGEQEVVSSALTKILTHHFGKVDGVVRGDLLAWRNNHQAHPRVDGYS